MISNIASYYDVVVVGAGPAGSFASHLLARSGLNVLLVERATFPRAKVCGGCLNALGVNLLKEAGLLSNLLALSPVPLKAFELQAYGSKLTLGISGGFAMSRASFDQMLVSAAQLSGVTFLVNTHAEIRESTQGNCTVFLKTYTEQREVVSKIVIYAGGLALSGLSKLISSTLSLDPKSKIGIGAVITESEYNLRPGVIQMTVGNSGYLGATKLEDGKIGLAAAINPLYAKQLGINKLVQNIFEDAHLKTPVNIEKLKWTGTPRLTRTLGLTAQKGVFVIGDAARYVEPFTGEGISWALLSASLIAPLVLKSINNSSEEYSLLWNKTCVEVLGNRQRLCSTLKETLRYPRVIGAALPLLGLLPFITQPILRRLNHTGTR